MRWLLLAWMVGVWSVSVWADDRTESPATQTQPDVEAQLLERLAEVPHRAAVLDDYAPPPQPASKRSGHIAGIALDAARRRMGQEMPTGRGVVVGLVEGGADSYRPNENDQSIQHLEVTLHDKPSNPSGHATATARAGFGSRGPAPDIERLHAFPVRPWLTDGYLNTGQEAGPVDLEARVFSHSWISDGGGGLEAVLRRADYVVDERDVIIVVGVNNGQNSKVPKLMASAYNVIAVGVPSGKHSQSYTVFEGEGRCKPELVAPAGLTSFATPVVAGVAAAMLEYADRTATEADNRSETIKSILLTGAFKHRGWKAEEGKPLDRVAGAGMVDVDRAMLILESGPVKPGAIDKRYGYAFESLPVGGGQIYDFHADKPLGEVAITLNWNRRVGGDRLLGAAVANLQLTLLRVNNDGTLEPVARSHSEVDNIEHLFFRSLPAGRYRVLVNRELDRFGGNWDYALSWRLEAANTE